MRIALMLTLLWLSGCAAPVRQAETASFDFGPAAVGKASDSGLGAVEVTAPSWLATPAMQYRLLYADGARRQGYGESRWAAPPAELLAQVLRRRLTGGEGGRCRLLVELDEFAQVFASPQGSRLALEGRAALYSGGEVLARHSFALAPPAPTADARGGVAAASSAVAALGDELADWLAAYRDRCRG